LIIKGKLVKLYKIKIGGLNGENIIYQLLELLILFKCVQTLKILGFKDMAVIFLDKTKVKLIQFLLNFHHPPLPLKNMMPKEMFIK